MSTKEEVQKFLHDNNLIEESEVVRFKNFLRTKKEGMVELTAFKVAELVKCFKEFPEFEKYRKTDRYGDSASMSQNLIQADDEQIRNTVTDELIDEELADNVGPLPGGDLAVTESDLHKKVSYNSLIEK